MIVFRVFEIILLVENLDSHSSYKLFLVDGFIKNQMKQTRDSKYINSTQKLL